MSAQTVTISQIEPHLRESANIQHGTVDGADIKTFIFRFLSLSWIYGVGCVIDAILIFSCAASGVGS